MTGEAAEMVARRFHEAYERLAPSFGYETRKASAKPWDEVPENNRKLMIAVCAEVQACVVGLIEAARELYEAHNDLWNTPLNARTAVQRHRMEKANTSYLAALRNFEQAAGAQR